MGKIYKIKTTSENDQKKLKLSECKTEDGILEIPEKEAKLTVPGLEVKNV